MHRPTSPSTAATSRPEHQSVFYDRHVDNWITTPADEGWRTHQLRVCAAAFVHDHGNDAAPGVSLYQDNVPEVARAVRMTSPCPMVGSAPVSTR